MTRGILAKPRAAAPAVPQTPIASVPVPIEIPVALVETLPVETAVIIEPTPEPAPVVEIVVPRPPRRSLASLKPALLKPASLKPASLKPASLPEIVVKEPALISSPWPVLSGEIRVLPSLAFQVGSLAILSPGEGEGTLRIQAAEGKLGDSGGGCWLLLSSGTLFWDNCGGGTVISNGYRIRGEDHARFSVVRIGSLVRVVVSAGKVLISGNGEDAALFSGDVFES